MPTQRRAGSSEHSPVQTPIWEDPPNGVEQIASTPVLRCDAKLIDGIRNGECPALQSDRRPKYHPSLGALFPFLCFREPVVTLLNIGLRFLTTYRSFRTARNVVIHFRGHFGVSKPGDDSHSVVREAVSARRALRISRSCRTPGWVPIASLRKRCASSFRRR